MADMSQLIQAMAQMQPQAQAALPIIPNNGNPQGANNMPNGNASPVMPGINATALQHYPWLAPSPSMDLVQQMLQNYPQFSNNVQPVSPQQPGGNMIPMPTNPAASQPVLPRMGSNSISSRGTGPVLPYNTTTLRRYME